MGLNAETINDLINGQENQQSIEDAHALIHGGHCILFAGSGTSKLAGYPLWPDLLDELQMRLARRGLNDPRKNPKDLLQSADDLFDCFASNNLLDPDYYSFLSQRFAPRARQSLDLQNILLSLPFCGIATPNWDICFETAIRTAWADRWHSFHRYCIHKDHPTHARQYFESLSRGFPSISVGHLHGVHEFAKEIILTGTQYEEAYGGPHEQMVTGQAVRAEGKWTFLRRTIWALMATRRLIFVGFGMNDPFIRALLGVVSGDLWDKTGQIHYFITHVSAENEKDPDTYRTWLREEMAVECIFYQVQDNDHSRLFDLLYKLGADPAASRRGQPPVSELLGPL